MIVQIHEAPEKNTAGIRTIVIMNAFAKVINNLFTF